MATKKTATKKTASKKTATKKTKRVGPAPADALRRAVTTALASVRAVYAALTAQGLVTLTPEGRVHSNGKLRDNEPEAMLSVLATVDANPGLFSVLAARDHGKNPKVVETAPARAALARREMLVPLLAELAQATELVSDDVLASGGLAKDVTVPAYAIITANAKVEPALRTKAKTAVDFYREAPLKAAATRKKSKK